jgi:ATP-dependent RNA helicase DeaD
MLRHIEGLTRQKIEVMALPTAAALRAKRLDVTRAALRERLVAGDLDDTRALVESLAHDFELIDIAAAAVSLMHDEAEQAAPAAAQAAGAPHVDRAPGGETGGPNAVLFIAAVKSAGLGPGDIVGAITGEAKISNRDIGGIRVGATHTLVEVPEAIADRVIKALRGTTLRGKKVNVRRASEPARTSPRSHGSAS